MAVSLRGSSETLDDLGVVWRVNAGLDAAPRNRVFAAFGAF